MELTLAITATDNSLNICRDYDFLGKTKFRKHNKT
jgi:hypothetical protein